MTYDEACEYTLTRAQALRELDDHGIGDADQLAEFFADCGDHAEYLGQVVLDWLGY